MASADDRDGEGVDWEDFAADEENAGWVVNIFERAGIRCGRFEQEGDLRLAAEGDFFLDVDFPFGCRYFPDELWSDTVYFAKLARRGLEDAGRTAEALQQILSHQWPHAAHHAEPKFGGENCVILSCGALLNLFGMVRKWRHGATVLGKRLAGLSPI